MSLLIKAYENNGKSGFDLKVKGDAVTVQEYLESINSYILKGNYDRLRRATEDCEGCNGCCRERIPLTYIDLLNLARAPFVKERFGQKEHLKDLLEEVAQIIIEGRSVDIILDRTETGECIFLDEKSKRCKIYQYRPMVCQTFICCAQSENAKQLRDRIVNLGEDELVRQWLSDCFQRKEPLFFHEAYEPDIRLEDWIETPFNRKSYDQVPLKAVCSEELWHNLKKED